MVDFGYQIWGMDAIKKALLKKKVSTISQPTTKKSIVASASAIPSEITAWVKTLTTPTVKKTSVLDKVQNIWSSVVNKVSQLFWDREPAGVQAVKAWAKVITAPIKNRSSIFDYNPVTPQTQAQKYGIEPIMKSTISATPTSSVVKPQRSIKDMFLWWQPILWEEELNNIDQKITQINTESRQQLIRPSNSYLKQLWAWAATIITSGLIGLKNSIWNVSQGISQVAAPWAANKISWAANIAMWSFGIGMSIFQPAITAAFVWTEELPWTKQTLDVIMSKWNDWFINNTKNVPIWWDMDENTKMEILWFARWIIAFWVLNKAVKTTWVYRANKAIKTEQKTNISAAEDIINANPGETLKDAYLRQMKTIRSKDPTGNDPSVKLQEQNMNKAFQTVMDAGIKDTIKEMNQSPTMWERIKELRQWKKTKGTATTTETSLSEIQPKKQYTELTIPKTETNTRQSWPASSEAGTTMFQEQPQETRISPIQEESFAPTETKTISPIMESKIKTVTSPVAETTTVSTTKNNLISDNNAVLANAEKRLADLKTQEQNDQTKVMVNRWETVIKSLKEKKVETPVKKKLLEPKTPNIENIGFDYSKVENIWWKNKADIIKQADEMFGKNNYELKQTDSDEVSVRYNVTPKKISLIKPKEKEWEQPSEIEGLTMYQEKEMRDTLRKEKGLSAADIMSKYPDINLKRDVTITDIHGKKSLIKKGEALSPYELKWNKVVLQDGETYIVSKNQRQNIKWQSVSWENKEFAPELKWTEETIFWWKDEYEKMLTKHEKAKKEKQEIAEKLWISYRDIYMSWLPLRWMYKKDWVPTDIPKKYQEKLYQIDDDMRAYTDYREWENAPTKYSQYTLPWWENYKEILIQAPLNKADKMPDFTTDEEYARRATSPYVEKQFKSSHRNQPNVLAHLRMNERTYNGKKVAFMEELQSDWAREVRKYEKNKQASIDFEEYRNFIKEKYKDDLRIKNKALRSIITSDELAKLNDLESKVGGIGPDSHPLLKNRQEMAVKRALKEAVNSGAEYFSWINGEQTAARYNLSKQIESIWREKYDDTKSINIIPKQWSIIELVIDKDWILIDSPSEWRWKLLSDVVWKGISEKIMNENRWQLKEEWLNIWWERAYKLYDEQVANIVKDLTGKTPEKISLSIYEKDAKIKKVEKNQAIRLTPDVVAKIKWEAFLENKPSGKLPFADTQPSEIQTMFQEKNKTIGTTTQNEAIKRANEQYPTIMKRIKVDAVDKIFTPRGTEAFGSYKDRLIKIAQDPLHTTIDHEIFHSVVDLFLTDKEKLSLFKAIKKESWIDNMVKAEEWAARKYEEYVKGNEKVTRSKNIREIFRRLWKRIKGIFSQKKTVNDFFEEILNGKKKWLLRRKPTWEVRYNTISDFMDQMDPERPKFIKKVAAIEAREQLIGKVAGKKISAEAADRQRRAWEKDKEGLIEDIAETYDLDTNDAYDKYDDFVEASYKEINTTKTQKKEIIRKQMENYFGEEPKKEIKHAVNKMVNARWRWRDVSEVKAYNEAKAILQSEEKPVERVFDKSFYEQNKPGEKVKKSMSFGRTAADLLEPISYRLSRMNPMIGNRLRMYDYAEINWVKNAIDASRTFLDEMKELRKDPIKYNEADLALKNRDIKKIEELWIHVPRDVLDLLINTAKDLWIDVWYLDEYFPRIVVDPEWLMANLAGTDAWSAIDAAIKARSNVLWRPLTFDEKVWIANKLIAWYKVEWIRIWSGNIKERTIDVITAWINRYYMDPVDGFLSYIGSMVRMIEMKKLFGSEDPEQSLWTFTTEMKEKWKITAGQENELKELLNARFTPMTSKDSLQMVGNLISLATMWSPISTISQIQDFANSIYIGVPYMFGEMKINVKDDLWIDKISEEFSDIGKLQEITKATFTISWFSAMDRLGKNTLVNTALRKYQHDAKKWSEELYDELMWKFDDKNRVDQIMKDLKNWNISDDVKFLLFDRLADFQPLTRSEMPLQYNKWWRNPLYYKLRSFAIKQIASIRREGLDKMKDWRRRYKKATQLEKEWKISHEEAKKNRKKARRYAIKWAKDLLRLSTYLVLMGVASDEIKDFLLMRKSSNIRALINDEDTSFGDRFLQNVIKISGLTKYAIMQASKEWVMPTVWATIGIPVSFLDYMYKDLIMLTTNKNLSRQDKLQALDTYQVIPLAGKMYYWWFGQPTMTKDHYDILDISAWLKKKKYYKDIFTGEIIKKKWKKSKTMKLR